MDQPLISAAMDRAFAALFAFMKNHSVEPTGAPMAVYLDYDPEQMAFRAGISVSAKDAEKAEGDIKADVTPGGEVHTFTHVGPYATLREAYVAVEGELAKRGKGLGVPTWEVYLNDPATTPPEELRTEVFSVLSQKGV